MLYPNLCLNFAGRRNKNHWQNFGNNLWGMGLYCDLTLLRIYFGRVKQLCAYLRYVCLVLRGHIPVCPLPESASVSMIFKQSDMWELKPPDLFVYIGQLPLTHDWIMNQMIKWFRQEDRGLFRIDAKARINAWPTQYWWINCFHAQQCHRLGVTVLPNESDMVS